MTDLAESLDILKDFPPVPTKAWEASIHVDLKGEDYNKKLVWNSDEGIEVRPYYRSEDINDLESQIGLIPATFPFVRGRGSQSWKQVESQREVAADGIRVDAIHEQGGTIVQELGYGIALGVERLVERSHAGGNVDEVAKGDVLVETIGVGQSEIEVSSMTDFFLLLMIPGAGDEFQGIKRGIVEMVDGMVINKADGENVCAARRARSQYESALRMFAPNRQGWTARVLTCSELENRGIREVWQMILDHRAQQEAGGHLERRRQAQALSWMRELISSGLQEIFQNASAVQERLDRLERSVREGTKSPSRAARELLGLCHDLSPRPSMGSGSPPVPDRQCAEPFEKTIA